MMEPPRSVDRRDAAPSSFSSAPSASSTAPAGGAQDLAAASMAAMEAAKRLSATIKPAAKPRVSRFSNTILTKKMYLPTHATDIDYISIFNGPFKMEVESDTHTTLEVRGTASVVTEMDEPLHVLISAGNQDMLDDAANRVSEVFNKPDLARRLAQKAAKLAETPVANPMASSVKTIFSGEEIGVRTAKTIQVPFAVVGLIIGRKGDNLRHLQEIFGVSLRIQNENEVTDGSVMRDVAIRGREEMIGKVEEVIKTIVQTGRDDIITKLQSSRDGFEKVPVPNDRVGLVIGKGGATIKELMSKTSTQIQVPREPDKDDPAHRSIIITGDTKNVMEAKKMIQDIVDGQMGSIPAGLPVTTISIPDDKVGLVIGKQGSIIKDIQRITKAFIQIPGKPVPGSNPPVRLVSIAGNEEEQNAAKREIQKMIGTTAGANEYKESEDAGMWGGMAGMPSLFNSAMDLDQLMQYMNQQAPMAQQAYYNPQPVAQPKPAEPVPEENKEEPKEAPPGFDDEAPPGFD